MTMTVNLKKTATTVITSREICVDEQTAAGRTATGTTGNMMPLPLSRGGITHLRKGVCVSE